MRKRVEVEATEVEAVAAEFADPVAVDLLAGFLQDSDNESGDDESALFVAEGGEENHEPNQSQSQRRNLLNHMPRNNDVKECERDIEIRPAECTTENLE